MIKVNELKAMLEGNAVLEEAKKEVASNEMINYQIESTAYSDLYQALLEHCRKNEDETALKEMYPALWAAMVNRMKEVSIMVPALLTVLAQEIVDDALLREKDHPVQPVEERPTQDPEDKEAGKLFVDDIKVPESMMQGGPANMDLTAEDFECKGLIFNDGEVDIYATVHVALHEAVTKHPEFADKYDLCAIEEILWSSDEFIILKDRESHAVTFEEMCAIGALLVHTFAEPEGTLALAVLEELFDVPQMYYDMIEQLQGLTKQMIQNQNDPATIPLVKKYETEHDLTVSEVHEIITFEFESNENSYEGMETFDQIVTDQVSEDVLKMLLSNKELAQSIVIGSISKVDYGRICEKMKSLILNPNIVYDEAQVVFVQDYITSFMKALFSREA